MRTVIASTIVLSIALLGCGGSAGSAAPTTGSSPSPSATTTVPTGVGSLAGVPTACYGLGVDDCQLVVDHVATALDATAPSVRYVQIGPFGCAAGERCPTTLAARPEGDVTLDTGEGQFSFHVVAKPGVPEMGSTRQDAFGIAVAPSSTPPLTIGPQPLALGHCGLWSGIDVGGTWWDPVGAVDADHPDAINSAEGTLNVLDPDHAVYTSRGGLTVQLVRRQGDKYLPPCM